MARRKWKVNAYYWAHVKGFKGWIVVEWSGKQWYSCGSEEPFDTSELVIGEEITRDKS